MTQENEYKWTSRYWHPALTADAVVFGFDGKDLNILLVQRKEEPFKDCWALPGGFMIQKDDNLLATVTRELKGETGVEFKNVPLEEIGCFSERGRDPREEKDGERVVTVAFYALVKKSAYEEMVKADTDAKKAEWFKVEELQQLSFDHNKIVEAALKKLRQKIVFEPIGFELLDEEFTLPQLQNIYLSILDPKRENPKLCDRRNFQNKMLGYTKKSEKHTGRVHFIEQVEGTFDSGKRPANKYRFNKDAYLEAKKNGIRIEFYC